MRIKLFDAPTTDDPDWFYVEIVFVELDLIGPMQYGRVAAQTDMVIIEWCLREFGAEQVSSGDGGVFIGGYQNVVALRLRWDGAPAITSV